MEPKEIKINKIQDKWLESKGGRTIKDVEVDKLGLFVWMGDGYGGEKKVYLPKDLS